MDAGTGINIQPFIYPVFGVLAVCKASQQLFRIWLMRIYGNPAAGGKTFPEDGRNFNAALKQYLSFSVS
ncbi:hypothetical protein FYJ45_22625 [Eisenbergiella tayi]|uniref:Uncharacterized protein n=1 Tax=Eisenbergiella porci TaxID=2652274 RepID=A0A6N7WJR0_9FIRM|nr:hypothetical protein [Eisenbergiella porci]